MANKREFKKDVEAVGSSACEAMMETYYNVKGVDKAAIEQAIEKVLGAIGAAKSNANIYFDKGVKAFSNPKEYSIEKKKFFVKLFNKITDDFNKEIEEALKQFNAAIPQEVKEQQKNEVAQ